MADISNADFPVDAARAVEQALGSVDRLIFLATRTLVSSARGLPGCEFPTGISPWDPGPTRDRHPLTNAQCLIALQDSERVLPTLELTAVDRRDLPRGSSAELRDLGIAVRKTIVAQLRSSLSVGSDPAPSSPAAALRSGAFGMLNPFTASQVLRVSMPTGHAYTDVWWLALFAVLWPLLRQFPAADLAPGASIGDSEPTAFVTAQCIDALDTVVAVLRRRRDRLGRVMSLIRQMRQLEREQTDIAALSSPALQIDVTHRRLMVRDRLRGTLQEVAGDAAFSDLFTKFTESFGADSPTIPPDAGTMASRFVAACADPGVQTRLAAGRDAMKSAVDSIERKFVQPLEQLARLVTERLDAIANGRPVKGAPKKLASVRTKLAGPEMPFAQNPFFREALNLLLTRISILPEEAVDTMSVGGVLQQYWADQASSAKHALDACRELSQYIGGILDAYLALKEAGPDPLDGVGRTIDRIGADLDKAVQRLDRRIEPAVHWCRYVMSRHLMHLQSGRWTQFEPGELAASLRAVARMTGLQDLPSLLGAFEAAMGAQRSDGTWAPGQPFFRNEVGMAAHLSSADVAWALANTFNRLSSKAEQYGVQRDVVTRLADPTRAGLGRFVAWLVANSQQFAWPPTPVGHFGHAGQIQVFGWCSDRAAERDRIHIAFTATALEFLVEYRSLLQALANHAVLSTFTSYRPHQMTSLDAVSTTDLDTPVYESRLIPQLMAALRPHALQQLRDRDWMPGTLDFKVELYSAILYGPPGSSKTLLAKAIARELGWHLVVLTPSDFLARGEEYVEARARDIFTLLQQGSHCVYFFDEVDELLLSRDEPRPQTVFSFLTPSFLTKLQDLRDAAKRKRTVFLIGTNYFDRMDDAVKRRGRIDRHLPVLYPDVASRTAIARGEIRDRWAKSGSSSTINQKAALDEIAKAGELLSYTMLVSLCDQALKEPDGARFNTLLEEVSRGGHRELKPEIGPTFYAGRARAVDEFIDIVLLAPNRFPSRKEALSAFLSSIGNETQRRHALDTAAARTFVGGDEIKTLRAQHFPSADPAPRPSAPK